jgi:hypothetical protein
MMRALALMVAGVLALAPTPAFSSDPTEEAAHELREELRALREELRAERETLREERASLEGDSQPERVGYGGDVLVGPDETTGDVVSFGGDLRVEGHVTGDATAFGGDIIVGEDGRIDGDAVSLGGLIRVREGGELSGDRVAMDLPGLPVESGGGDGGALGAVASVSNVESLAATLYNRLVMFLSFAGAGVLVVGLFPARIGRIAEALEDRPVRAAFVGTFTFGFIALFSLLFTVVTLGLGSPLSLILVGLLGLAWLLGFVGLCQTIGDKLPFEHKPHGRWVAFLVGSLMLSCVGSLPVVGWLAVMAASVAAIGAATMTRFGGRRLS